MRYMMMLIALAALSACQTDMQPDDPELTCGAAQMQGLIGQPLSDLDISTLPAPSRVIGPGMAVTMDWNPARLNVEHDADNRITRIACG